MRPSTARTSQRARRQPSRRTTRRPTAFIGAAIAIALAVAGFASRSTSSTGPSSSGKATSSASAATRSNRSDPRLRRIGFASASKLHDHYAKHGQEFGDIDEARYLALAQDLRDAPISKTVLETEQVGGTVSRFDRSSGAFLAFNHDLTIRTFFRPNDGENYFWRAAKQRH